jgi:FKBP-type peptidyl-prolyl cis-trans isomerase FkpA
MKRILFTLLILSVIGSMSCRKNNVYPDIKQYDSQQITSYISSNGLTGMVKDTSGGDTTGIYYKIFAVGNTAKPIDYSDSVSFIYTLRSFDGKFIAADTILNHYGGLAGHISPNGLLLAVKNILKYKGGSMRVLIPSHLAFGVNGTGSGSVTITNGRIAGNQCLDYYVSVMDDQAKYDDLVIRNYLSRSNLTGYLPTTDGIYYKITLKGTGLDPITDNSSVTASYQGHLLNGTGFDITYATTPFTINIPQVIPGVAEILKMYGTMGTSLSFVLPSRLAYGNTVNSTIPANSCLKFDYAITAVSP